MDKRTKRQIEQARRDVYGDWRGIDPSTGGAVAGRGGRGGGDDDLPVGLGGRGDDIGVGPGEAEPPTANVRRDVSGVKPEPEHKHAQSPWGMVIKLQRIKGTTLGASKRILERPYYFQCPPMENFTHQHGFNHPTYTVATGAEYSQIAGRKLIAVQFKTLVVEWARFALWKDWDVQRLVDHLVTIGEEGWPIHLTCTNRHYSHVPELEMDATIETVDVTQNAGENDARYIDIAFQEWVDPVVSVKSRKGGKDFPFVITLHADGSYNWPHNSKKPAWNQPLSFQRIARYAYGNPSLAKRIAKAQHPSMADWGNHTPLVQAPRYKLHGGKIIVPGPPHKHSSGVPGSSGSVPQRVAHG